VLSNFPAKGNLGGDRRGSSWPVLIQTAAGSYVTKLRGAAERPLALAAEVPRSFLESRGGSGPAEFDLERRRAAYVAFLRKRLGAARPFLPSARLDTPA
jgi:hypothetical protein